MHNKFSIMLLIFLSLMLGCHSSKETSKQEILIQEKSAILNRLNNETKDAFQRDYEAWKENWVHDSRISKIYINYTDSTFSESVGWQNISKFIYDFMQKHPEPEPTPKLLDSINVRFYENGAWVTFYQQDSIRGLKRETRLMEKINGAWKIAGMQTVIYGSQYKLNE